jgi:hypothetical protein
MARTIAHAMAARNGFSVWNATTPTPRQSTETKRIV